MLNLTDVYLRQDDFELRANLTIGDGRCVAVMGPSGAGKSTLLSILGGFQTLTSGRLTWHDADISDVPPSQRNVAMVFQDNNLFPHMTAFQNVGLGIAARLKLRKAEVDRVNTALDAVGLAGLGARRPSELSGGQQSRVALARLLVQRKPLILMDEPFSALGPAMRLEMADLARDIAERTSATLLMVSHDFKDVERIADDVIWVEAGVCLPPQPLSEFLASPPSGFTDYLG
ncbi:thiamine transport system ATP-binding protein [Pacificibacter maritimus]|uniref:Thiamine transport system ATP-binding protein n=1 Tax=Pacificibacter maritimus TaxID=762213 RepID=A0A3N4USW3_9RHOB|nr:ATP-binding cassette domain-containing protein [Pacificibacter maritimus]RPE64780.1 thiamine transport system ATP-binding protein [Pacificibacter maritimus]